MDSVMEILSRNPARVIEDSSLTPAGVMVLLYSSGGQHSVVLQKRSQLVEHHKGEISFPGGVKDGSDSSLLDTALRELNEEMGVFRDDVTVLGQLDDVSTNTNFLIRSFVGCIPFPYDFVTNDAEVDQILEFPLSALMDEANRRDEIHIVNGSAENVPVFIYKKNIVFGATARILDRLIQLLRPMAW